MKLSVLYTNTLFLFLTTVAMSAPEFAWANTNFDSAIVKVESQTKGRIGVFAMRGSLTLSHRASERFAYCSTFKWVLGADILKKVEEGQLSFDRKVNYSRKDLIGYSPVTTENVGKGTMSIEDLVAATIKTSDNAAANLLEPLVGGTSGLQSFVRNWGDSVMRFDRMEPEMSDNDPGDLRDTTSPEAMTRLLKTALETEKLSKASRERLLNWMKAATTGLDRIRASVPKGWPVGDKTGTCGHGGANDVAVVVPPKGEPIYVSIFTDGDRTPHKVKEQAIAEVAKIVLKAL